MFAMPGSSVLTYDGCRPQIAPGVFLASGSVVAGDLTIGRDSSIWFHTVIRADCQSIRIGERTNIQDHSMVHVSAGEGATVIGNDVTIGHRAIIHACTIEDLVLIGMGAIVLDGARIQRGSLVAAGALVPPGKTYPPRSLIKGAPGVVARQISDKEFEEIAESARHYVAYARGYMS